MTSQQILVSVGRYSRPVSLAYWRHWMPLATILLFWDFQIAEGRTHNCACLGEEVDSILQIVDTFLVSPHLVDRRDQ